MRILYGVSGEGSGHSSRARVALRHLAAAGHEVRVASYDRGYRNLHADFDALEIEGLSIATADNQVSIVRTFTENLGRLPDGWRALRELRRWGFHDYEPDVVITDFEPMSAYLARNAGLPLLSIDNQHRMRWMEYPCPPDLSRDAKLAETVVRLLVPKPDAALVTTFWFGEVKNERTFLVPPILRQEVRDRTPTEGEHVLVYATKGFESLLERLRACPRERFHVYGFDRPEGEDGNLVFRPFSVEGFLDDLAAARAVVATAGFTLMTEALSLRKPMLALPMAGQFEQALNALLLGDSGCGRDGRDAGDDTLGDFLYRLPEHRERLAAYELGDPDTILAELDRLLADDAAELRRLREARRQS